MNPGPGQAWLAVWSVSETATMMASQSGLVRTGQMPSLCVCVCVRLCVSAHTPVRAHTRGLLYPLRDVTEAFYNAPSNFRIHHSKT